LWKYFNDGPKPKKVLINPRDGKWGSPTEAGCWDTYEIANLAYEDKFYDDIQGLGYVFTGDYIAIDLDDCVHDGVLNETAQGIVSELNTYTEYSPSGKGVHLIAKGSIPCDKGIVSRINGQRIEIYTKGRYFCMTGNVLPDCPNIINDVDLSPLYTRLDKKAEIKNKNKNISVSTIDECKVPLDERIRQATPYLLKCKGTEAGKGEAEKSCISVCKAMLWGFALPIDIALELIKKHWADREDQTDEFGNHYPWSESDIQRKLEYVNSWDYEGVIGDKLNNLPKPPRDNEINAVVKKNGECNAIEMLYNQVASQGTQPLPQPRENKKNKDYDFYLFSDLEKLPPPEWLIDNHFVAKSINEIWGESGSGKSFYALDMALSVAHGIDFLGQWKTKKANVLYLASEGWDGIYKRGKAWSQAHNMPLPSNIMICSNAVNIPDDWEKFIKSAKAKYGQYPEFVVIDTLNLNFGAGDENSTKDMTRFIVAIREINELTKATIVVIHHSGKDVSKGSRGSYSLKCAVSTEIYVEGTGQAINTSCIDSLKVECKKQKDAPPFAPYHLKAKHFDLGDKYGSLALAPLDKLQEEYQDLKCNVAIMEFLQEINRTYGNGQFNRKMVKDDIKTKSANTVDSYITALTNRGLLGKVGGNAGKGTGKTSDLFFIKPQIRENLINAQIVG
jgi:hypothetical protein